MVKSQEMMKAVVARAFGGPEVLQYREIAIPEPRADEVLIKVLKTSINYADIKTRTGMKKNGQVPFLLGLDCVGIIEKAGSDVTEFSKGDRVIAFPAKGSYAEYATAPALLTYKIPNTLDNRTAAASPIAAFLSYTLIHKLGLLQPGDSVLVHAAAGGIGTMAVQYAKYFGAGKIIGTVSSLTKADAVIQAGADHVITYDEFHSKVNTYTNGIGVDLILDSLAGQITAESLLCLAEYGKLINFGNTSGKQGTVVTSDLHGSCRSVLGFSLGNTRKKRPAFLKDISQDVITHLDSGVIHAVIGQEYHLSEIQAAHRAMQDRNHIGKILLHVSD